MKFTFLFFFISFPLMAIELKINGVTYDIEEYKVENNGKRIIPTLLIDGESYTNPGIPGLIKLFK